MGEVYIYKGGFYDICLGNRWGIGGMVTGSMECSPVLFTFELVLKDGYYFHNKDEEKIFQRKKHYE